MPCSREAPPRLLLIAPPNSYRTVSYIESARRYGVDILVASEGEYSLVNDIASGLHVDLSSAGAIDKVLEAAQLHPFSGVVATDDSTVELGSRVAKKLGLPHNDPLAARTTRRKDLSRAALRDAGVAVPDFRVMSVDDITGQLAGLSYPCVVKPLSMSASRGVIRVNNADELSAACQRVTAIITENDRDDEYVRSHLLLESFVAGPEVAVEGLLQHGEFTLLAIFDKPDPLEGPYFEETYYITPSRHSKDIQQQLVTTVAQACQGMGLREGPVHAELRINASTCTIIEVASRTIGGECARLLDFGTGRTLEDMVIAHALGESLDYNTPKEAVGVLMIPITTAGVLRRIEGITLARAIPYIEDILISIREGYELVALPEGSSYLGFMFARAPTPQQVEAALRAAHDQLTIVVAPMIKIEDQRMDARR